MRDLQHPCYWQGHRKYLAPFVGVAEVGVEAAAYYAALAAEYPGLVGLLEIVALFVGRDSVPSG